MKSKEIIKALLLVDKAGFEPISIKITENRGYFGFTKVDYEIEIMKKDAIVEKIVNSV